MKRLACLLPALALLGGCVSFGAAPPRVLLTLDTSAPVAAGASRSASEANTILVLTPTAPVAIATPRIPVYSGAQLAYVAKAAWNEPPARAMQRLLSETITARTTRVVLDPRQFTTGPAMRLSGQLQRFGIDPARMEAVAVFDAQLSRGSGIETRRFEARTSVAAIDGPNAGQALNRAANDLAAQIAAWVG